MAAYFGSDFNDLAKLLFRCLTSSNPNFNAKAYLNEFGALKTNLERVNFVYKDIKKYPNHFAKFTKDNKDDATASQHADSGKVKFHAGNYFEALEEYTRSVATAESNRVLALAYGNRSECFLELNMPKECIEDIKRALKHHYPNELVEDLLVRQRLAERRVPSDKNYYERIVDGCVHKNPSIQCASDCVKIEHNEEFGRHVVATRDVAIGEILSAEPPFTSVLIRDRYTHCHHCLILCYNPLPCNSCTVALFCSEACQTNARSYHKYECPVLLTVCYRILCEFAIDDSMLLALKIALLAENGCDSVPNKKDDCYRSDRYKEIAFADSPAKLSHVDVFHQAILTALVFELLWNYTSFFSGIFSSSDTEDKFKEVMLLQLQNSLINAADVYEYVQKYGFNGTSNFGCGAYAFFSLFTHSCCANVMKTYHGTTMVLRALNTIKEGEQCFVNRYSLRYDSSSKTARQQFLFSHALPDCHCRACEENWSANLGNMDQVCQDLGIDAMALGDVVAKVIGTDVDKAKDFLPRLIRLLGECEGSEPSGNALALKNLIVHCYVLLGNKKLEFDPQRDIVLSI